MEIKVRVLNGSSDKKEEEKHKPTILTSAYVKKLNKQIEYNIQAREKNKTLDSFTLKRIIR